VRVRSVLTYVLPRVLILVVVTWLLTLAGAHWMLAVVIGSLIAMLLSIIFLQRPRQAVADRMESGEAERRARREARAVRREAAEGPSDEALEDRDLDETLGAGTERARTRAAQEGAGAAQDSAADTDSPTSSRSE
jgi:hypothetical protein